MIEHKLWYYPKIKQRRMIRRKNKRLLAQDVDQITSQIMEPVYDVSTVDLRMNDSWRKDWRD